MVAVDKAKPRRSGAQSVWILLGLLCALGVGAGLAVNNLSLLTIEMAQARARQLAVEALNNAIDEVMEQVGGYSDLVSVITDDQGRVTMLKANTLLMNDLASRAALAAQRNLQALADEGISLPLGAALGNGLLGGAGPRIRVGVLPVGSVETRFVTAFHSAGINQTRHEISLEASALMNIVVPVGSGPVSVNAYVPVAESIIVGQVPESYVDVADNEDMLNLIP